MRVLKDFVAISPLIGAFLIFLGMLKLIIYYSFFGVHIVQYIQFSEILSSFLEDLNLIILLFLILIIHGVVGFKLIVSNSSDFSNLRTISKSLNSKFAIWYYPIAFILSYILFVVYPNLFWAYFTVILFFSFLMVLFKRYFSKIKLDETWSQIAFFSLLIVFFTINLAIKDVINTRKNSRKVEIQLKDECIKLNSNERFIGKTNEYLFISNVENNRIRIINCNEVKSLIIVP